MKNQTITIDLERFVDFDSLEENVIRELAKICESKLTGGHTESFHNMCVTAINEVISGRIEERVSELIEKPILSRDRFGEMIEGVEAKTLGDMLADAVDFACQETVDTSGKPTRSTAYQKTIPRMQWHLSRLLAREIDAEAKKAIDELQKDAKEKVRQQIAAAVAAQLAK